MTTIPDPDNPDTENTAVPPYEGRRETADVDADSTDGDANTGGASGTVEDDQMKAPDPEETPGGATASPADEQPAQDDSGDADSGSGAATGPAHTTGTGRAEDQS